MISHGLTNVWWWLTRMAGGGLCHGQWTLDTLAPARCSVSVLEWSQLFASTSCQPCYSAALCSSPQTDINLMSLNFIHHVSFCVRKLQPSITGSAYFKAIYLESWHCSSLLFIPTMSHSSWPARACVHQRPMSRQSHTMMRQKEAM